MSWARFKRLSSKKDLTRYRRATTFDGGGSDGPLLDVYGGAAAAYSLRQLSVNYTGSAIRVRRSSDNAEQDIGFSDGLLDTASLSSFCGADNGFVTSWYDQSGNSNNATQITAINQPRIYDSSTGLITLGGQPALDFNSSFDFFVDYLNMPNFSTFQNVTVASVIGDLLSSNFPSDNFSTYYVKYDLWQAGLNATSFGPIVTTHQLNFLLATNGANTLYNNNTAPSASPVTGAGSAGAISKIGARADLNNQTFMQGKFQELVIYQLDQTANRLGIQNNINSHYNIY